MERVKSMFDFFHAALPWIAMGVLLAVFAVRSASKKKKDEKELDDYGSEGMSIGMCFGVALGSSTSLDLGLGLSLGMLIGLAVGSSIKKTEEKKK
ncbi:MAG: hypothetical protein MJ077_03085 [Oscillospiraceae bacterium]|nr:hypothetical protein [Oscillospiraceae bacterium]